MARLATMVLILLAGCGGGGGGSADAPFFGGVWRGAVAILENACDLPFFPASLSFTHTVNQDGRQVVLDVLGGGSFRGAVESDNSGFIATGTPTTSQDGPVVCSGTPGILYVNVEGDHADVGLALVLTCVNALKGSRADCEVLYAGRATRD